MDKKYILRNALVLNASKEKFDAVAEPIDLAEIKKNKKHFGFDFLIVMKDGFTVYKIYRIGEPNKLQGLVAFKASPGVLLCANMETALHNRGKSSLYNGLGKAMIALCCKVSFDNEMDGFISFEAKNSLFEYYERYGAYLIGQNRMAIKTDGAKKLVAAYF
jgi:hypothetical protein